MSAVVHIYHSKGDQVRELVLQRAPGCEIVSCTNEEQLRENIADAEILLTGVLPREVLGLAQNLRWLQHMGAGVDRLLPAPELPSAVQITNTRGIYAPQVAEHAIALLLALHRGFPSHFASQLERRWQPFASTPLAGSTVTILGLGEIGSRVAAIAAAMKMKVIGVTRCGKPVTGVEQVLAGDRLLDALEGSTSLIVTVPLTVNTRQIIGAAELSALGEHALVVNIGRGGLIDETALLSALESGQLGGAALDVFENEPLAADSPWWTAPNTIVTPHSSGYTVGHVAGICDFFARNLRRYEAGEPLLNVVDRDLGY